MFLLSVTESFYLIHSSDICMERSWGWWFMFVHVSDHSHPAPWVVVGRLPSWERLFYFFSLSPLYLFVFLWWWCWKWCPCWWFLLSCIYVKSLSVAAERSQHVALEPSQIRVALVNFCVSFFTPFLMIGLHADVSAFSFWMYTAQTNFISKFLVNQCTMLVFEIVVSVYKSEMGTLKTHSTRDLIKPACLWGHVDFYE